MQLRIGPPPLTPGWEPAAEGWTQMPEPAGWLMQAWALVVAVVLAVASVLFWAALTPFAWDEINWLWVIVAIPLVSPVHELVHAIVAPRARADDREYLGFSPWHVGFYVHHTGALSRRRYVVVGLAPLLLMSVVPIVFCAVWQIRLPWLMYVSIANALGSCADLLGTVLILTRIPRRATIRQQGTQTWWRMPGQNAIAAATLRG